MTDSRAARTRAGGRLSWLLLLGAALTSCTAVIEPSDANVVGVSGGSGMQAGSAGAAGVAGAAGGPPVTAACTPLTPVSRRVWRLSVEQFGNSVRDLLGLAKAPALNNNGGTSQYAFFSDDSATVDANLQFSIYETVRDLMPQITPKIAQLTACTAGEANEACAQRFAKSFGGKAFRRGLDDGEVTALMQVYSAEGNNTDFATGIGLMIQALLQSPSFLHRTELGPTTLAPDTAGVTSLNPFEVATQLSFLLTNSTPDSALLAAASDGTLATNEGVSAQIDRMLKLDVVRQNITNITLDWFNVNQLVIKTKAASFFESLPMADQLNQPAIQADLLASTQKFIQDVLWNGSGKIGDLVTSQKVFVNKRLATLYGYDFTGQTPDQFVAVTDTHRAGLLTQPAFLWSMSDPASTSIVHRGRFIHDDVVCQDPGPGPGALLDDPTIQAKLAMLPTELDKSQYRMATALCRGCHAQIDPYALVLQNFDAIGAWRTVADGVPVDPTGAYAAPSPLANQTLVGPVAFAKALVDGNLLTNCAAQKIASYVIGRMIRVAATCEVRDIQSKFAQTDGSMTSLFRQVALAKFTRERTGGAQ